MGSTFSTPIARVKSLLNSSLAAVWDCLYSFDYFINVWTNLGDGKGSGYNSIIPDAPGADSHPLTKECAEKIGDLVDQYVKAMENVKLKNGLEHAMKISDEGNKYLQIPQLDFEIPPESQRGSLSTVEGILVRASDELQALQDERKKIDPQTAEAIHEFILKLRACATGNSSFTFILDDPAGNSFVENPYAPSPDPSLTIDFYERTPEQTASLGYLVDQSQMREDGNDGSSNNQASEPHGSVGAVAGRRAIAQGNSAEFAEALFRYTAPEEVVRED